jgi:N-acyl homoserine lactone hydrolase
MKSETCGMYKLDVLVQGFPGRSVCHGGLGWSTIALLRSCERTVLIDVGAFGVRRELRKQLSSLGVDPSRVTDVVLTHAHYDHAVNFTLFPSATVWIGERELEWACAQQPGFDPLPELYVRELATSTRVRRLKGGDCPVPNLQAIEAFGHTPGHLVFLLAGTSPPVLFTGDAAKNRAELLCRTADASMDIAQSQRTFDRIWSLWSLHPDMLLVPGHDVAMRLEQGVPVYVAERKAAIAAWFDEHLELTTEIDLVGPRQANR